MICPCCHREMPEEEFQRAERRKAVQGAVQGRVLEKLERSAQFIPGRELADHVYALDPNGGPDNPEICIHHAVKSLNKRLPAKGWMIRSRIGRGGGYLLERLNG